ncbi:MAG TPA: NAD-dependent epimerase/dehydratase family protein, partial [Chthoniobacterales bacterium]
MASICVTGGTGYIGSRLIPLLINRGHRLKAVVRPGSEKKIPANASIVSADPLQENSYTESIRGCDTFIHLIGVPHPSPAKAA